MVDDWQPYLHFGYLPDSEKGLPFDLSGYPAQLSTNFTEAVEEASCVLNATIRDSLDSNKKHYVPLSGGLDSRALLCCAVEHGTNVEAVTFGVPGTMDFEFGAEVARFMGCTHIQINLLEFIPDFEALVGCVQAGAEWTYVFDAYFNRLISQFVDEHSVVLSGFLGDPIAGGHLDPTKPTDYRVRKAFAESQRFSRRLVLTPQNFDPLVSIPDYEDLQRIPGLTPYEALDMSVRQVNAIRPIVVDDKLDYRTPFAASEWVGLMLSAQSNWRYRSRLYEAVLLQRWPEVFHLPTKNHLGLGLNASYWQRQRRRLRRAISSRLTQAGGPNISRLLSLENYLDMNWWFRFCPPLRRLAYVALESLASRGIVPWISPVEILNAHLSGQDNYGREIQVLIGLEANLVAACE